MASPKVFISYGHDSPEHGDRVLELADRLRGEGLDVRLDQYETHPSHGWAYWVRQQIVESDFVLLVCSPAHRDDHDRTRSTSADALSSRSRWEVRILEAVLYESSSRDQKLVPLLLEGCTVRDVPVPLRVFTCYRLPGDYEDLYRRLTNQPKVLPPPIGSIRSIGAAEAQARSSLPSSEGDHQGRRSSTTSGAPIPDLTNDDAKNAGGEDVARQPSDRNERGSITLNITLFSFSFVGCGWALVAGWSIVILVFVAVAMYVGLPRTGAASPRRFRYGASTAVGAAAGTLCGALAAPSDPAEGGSEQVLASDEKGTRPDRAMVMVPEPAQSVYTTPDVRTEGSRPAAAKPCEGAVIIASDVRDSSASVSRSQGGGSHSALYFSRCPANGQGYRVCELDDLCEAEYTIEYSESEAEWGSGHAELDRRRRTYSLASSGLRPKGVPPVILHRYTSREQLGCLEVSLNISGVEPIVLDSGGFSDRQGLTDDELRELGYPRARTVGLTHVYDDVPPGALLVHYPDTVGYGAPQVSRLNFRSFGWNHRAARLPSGEIRLEAHERRCFFIAAEYERE